MAFCQRGWTATVHSDALYYSTQISSASFIKVYNKTLIENMQQFKLTVQSDREDLSAYVALLFCMFESKLPLHTTGKLLYGKGMHMSLTAILKYKI